MSDDDFSVDTARAAAERGDLEQWLVEFLASPGSDNAELGEQLCDEGLHWLAPVELSFKQLHRLAGPPDEPTMERLDDDDLERAEAMADELEEGWDPPPLVVTKRRHQLVLEDGNHRIEGLRRAGRRRWWAVVGFETASDRELFEPLVEDD